MCFSFSFLYFIRFKPSTFRVPVHPWLTKRGETESSVERDQTTLRWTKCDFLVISEPLTVKVHEDLHLHFYSELFRLSYKRVSPTLWSVLSVVPTTWLLPQYICKDITYWGPKEECESKVLRLTVRTWDIRPQISLKIQREKPPKGVSMTITSKKFPYGVLRRDHFGYQLSRVVR